MKSRPAYFKRLLKFLRRKGRSHEDAEDLIQEAMLRLHLYGREVPVHNEEAFLRHAVTNLSIDQHRRNRPDLRKEVPIEELNAHSPLVSTESTPEEALEAHQRLGRIRAALDAVSLRTGEIWSPVYTQHIGSSEPSLRRQFHPGQFPVSVALRFAYAKKRGSTREPAESNRHVELS